MNGEIHIAVLDKGFVYVGKCLQTGETLKITEAKNIRRWGTTQGLGQLVNGPTARTVVDEVGEVIAPMRSVNHLIPCKQGW